MNRNLKHIENLQDIKVCMLNEMDRLIMVGNIYSKAGANIMALTCYCLGASYKRILEEYSGKPKALLDEEEKVFAHASLKVLGGNDKDG